MTAAAKDAVAPTVRPGCQRNEATAGCSTRSHRTWLSSDAAIGHGHASLAPAAGTDLLGDLASAPSVPPCVAFHVPRGKAEAARRLIGREEQEPRWAVATHSDGGQRPHPIRTANKS